jgi:hypothetical protein
MVFVKPRMDCPADDNDVDEGLNNLNGFSIDDRYLADDTSRCSTILGVKGCGVDIMITE